MQDFLSNIDNKEILIELLHHSIDYLIGNRDDQHALKLCHKYGFHSPDDFMQTTRRIANCYRNFFYADAGSESELLSEFANLSIELQRLVPTILAARRPEVIKYLIRQHNARENRMVESFDWDLRFVLGDSSFARNSRQLATLTLKCDFSGKSSFLHFQMNRQKVDELIDALEKALAECSTETRVAKDVLEAVP